MSVRAGIVVTGTEVLTGRVSDRNGPWLAERLRELGVDLAHTTIVGDRPQDMRAALDFMADQRLDIVLTSGGLGPTADDKTAAVVGEFQGRSMILDEALSERIATIVAPLMKRWPNIDPEAVALANRKQATVPEGAEVLEPVGTAPGLVVSSTRPQGGPIVVVLPGPPRELQGMWPDALKTAGLKHALAGATVYRQRTMRLFGIPESEIAETLRLAEGKGLQLERLEVTTCLKRGEVEIVTRYEPAEQELYESFQQLIRDRHADSLFSEDGRTVDQVVAGLLRGERGGRALTIATAESCTGGLLAARLTELPGSSGYFTGAIVAYSNQVKATALDVPLEMLEEHGAVSGEVAEALARGVRSKLATDLGVGVTGVAGPDGSEAKPVGLVWIAVVKGEEPALLRSVNLPGGRADVRDRTTTVAMHLVRRALQPDA